MLTAITLYSGQWVWSSVTSPMILLILI